jgi:Glycosyltransferase 61
VFNRGPKLKVWTSTSQGQNNEIKRRLMPQAEDQPSRPPGDASPFPPPSPLFHSFTLGFRLALLLTFLVVHARFRFASNAPQPHGLRKRNIVPNVCAALDEAEAVAAAALAAPPCIVLMDRGSGQLYHYLILNIGALHRYYRRNVTMEVYTPWLELRKEGANFHRESMALFAPEFKFLPGNDSPTGSCAVEYGSAMYNDDRPEPAAHYFLRGLFTRVLSRNGGASFNASEMVYVTRKGSPRRSVLNEAALIPALSALGIRFVQLEELSFAGKLRLFASARLIISPQSAGLTFLAAADRRALVVEIYADLNVMHHYRNMASDLAVPFRRFTSVAVEGDISAVFSGDYNFVVDVPAFVAFLQHALEETDPVAKGKRICYNLTDAIDELAGITCRDREAAALSEPCGPPPEPLKSDRTHVTITSPLLSVKHLPVMQSMFKSDDAPSGLLN